MKDDNSYYNLLKEIRHEQGISPKIKDQVLLSYIKDGIYNINNSSGCKIDYDTDLDARRLLKNYVLYANHYRLAEFKELYSSEYVALQIKYYEYAEL